jgi:hypothetical protein
MGGEGAARRFWAGPRIHSKAANARWFLAIIALSACGLFGIKGFAFGSESIHPGFDGGSGYWIPTVSLGVASAA